MEKFKKPVYVILTILAALCLAGGGILFFHSRRQAAESEAALEALRASAEAVQTESTLPAGPEEPLEPLKSSEESTEPPEVSGGDAPSSEPPAPPAVENPYKDSYLANEDMAAWLQIPDTPIDYPVMWTPRDENYYLKRAFDGSSNENGCLILDTDSCLDPLTTNLIIHGHNMRSGQMFGTLSKYEDEEYGKEHSEIYLYTRECQRKYEVLAVFRSQVYLKTDQVFKFYKFFQADTQEEFDDFYQNIKALSLYDTGVTAEFGDNLITLSTCSYHVEQGRFVVVAKETETGDTYLPIEE